MHKSATKCNETIGKWCKNKHGASKIIDTFETYQTPEHQRNSHALPASACKICTCACLPWPRHDRFPPSVDLDDLGEHPFCETLAEAELLPHMQLTTGTTMICRRSPSNRMDGRPRTDSATDGLAGEPAGPLWPRSGEARPDPAPSLFFTYVLFAN
jgi:hypothetical protein